MSEETTTVKAPEQPPKLAFTVVNPVTGKSMDLKEAPFTRKGKNQGRTFYSPFDGDVHKWVDFWGVKKFEEAIRTVIDRNIRKYVDQATNDEGVFDRAAFDKMYCEWSARGESVPDIKARILELATVQIPLIFNDQSLSMMDKMTKVQEISEQIERLKRDIVEKTKKSDEDKKAEEEGLPT